MGIQVVSLASEFELVSRPVEPKWSRDPLGALSASSEGYPAS